MMLPPPTPTTEPAVTKDAFAEDERATATAQRLTNESAINTSSSSSSSSVIIVNDEKTAESPTLMKDTDNTTNKGKALVQPSSSGLLATATSPRKLHEIRRYASSYQETKSESKSSASSDRQRKKAAAGKTATQKSVLRSKMAFFLFLVTVAAVAGGKAME